jgi:hypothetical protein
VKTAVAQIATKESRRKRRGNRGPLLAKRAEANRRRGRKNPKGGRALAAEHGFQIEMNLKYPL